MRVFVCLFVLFTSCSTLEDDYMPFEDFADDYHEEYNDLAMTVKWSDMKSLKIKVNSTTSFPDLEDVKGALQRILLDRVLDEYTTPAVKIQTRQIRDKNRREREEKDTMAILYQTRGMIKKEPKFHHGNKHRDFQYHFWEKFVNRPELDKEKKNQNGAVHDFGDWYNYFSDSIGTTKSQKTVGWNNDYNGDKLQDALKDIQKYKEKKMDRINKLRENDISDYFNNLVKSRFLQDQTKVEKIEGYLDLTETEKVESTKSIKEDSITKLETEYRLVIAPIGKNQRKSFEKIHEKQKNQNKVIKVWKKVTHKILTNLSFNFEPKYFTFPSRTPSKFLDINAKNTPPNKQRQKTSLTNSELDTPLPSNPTERELLTTKKHVLEPTIVHNYQHEKFTVKRFPTRSKAFFNTSTPFDNITIGMSNGLTGANNTHELHLKVSKIDTRHMTHSGTAPIHLEIFGEHAEETPEYIYDSGIVLEQLKPQTEQHKVDDLEIFGEHAEETPEYIYDSSIVLEHLKPQTKQHKVDDLEIFGEHAEETPEYIYDSGIVLEQFEPQTEQHMVDDKSTDNMCTISSSNTITTSDTTTTITEMTTTTTDMTTSVCTLTTGPVTETTTIYPTFDTSTLPTLSMDIVPKWNSSLKAKLKKNFQTALNNRRIAGDLVPKPLESKLILQDKQQSNQVNVDEFIPYLINMMQSIIDNENKTGEDLVRRMNESLYDEDIPTCPPLPTTETVKVTNASTTTEAVYDYDGNMTGTIMGKCYVCGLEEKAIPYDAKCSDSFSTDLLNLFPIHSYSVTGARSYRKYCRYMDS